jgi:hypothetical protein
MSSQNASMNLIIGAVDNSILLEKWKGRLIFFVYANIFNCQPNGPLDHEI